MFLFVLCHEGFKTYLHADAEQKKNITLASFGVTEVTRKVYA